MRIIVAEFTRGRARRRPMNWLSRRRQGARWNKTDVHHFETAGRTTYYMDYLPQIESPAVEERSNDQSTAEVGRWISKSHWIIWDCACRRL